MTYTAKTWVDFPATTTPIDAAALAALEQRVAAYVADGQHAPGVEGYEDFRVKQRGAGANMSVDVGVASTRMGARITSTASSPNRYEFNGAQLNATIAAADATNPRIDVVYLASPASKDSVVPTVGVATGTATAGATLSNRTGTASVPAGAMILADVLIDAAAATIVTAKIRDRRAFAIWGAPPAPANSSGAALGTGVDLVQFQAVEGMAHGTAVAFVPTTHDSQQIAALMYLPRRIVGATRIRFTYQQGATPATSNYNIGIFDASGRQVVASGATAFAGGANARTAASLTITATTFEAGWYYVCIGLAAITAASTVRSYAVDPAVAVATGPGVAGPNLAFRAASGGTTMVTTLQDAGTFTDVHAAAAAQANAPVPIVSLSVG